MIRMTRDGKDWLKMCKDDKGRMGFLGMTRMTTDY